MTMDPLARWRLVLGEAAEGALGNSLDAQGRGMDAALEWLYGREGDLAERDVRGRQGGQGPSALTVPDWINEVHTLFPKETIERLERDAVERYKIDEVVTRADVLSRVEPNETLLRAVLRTKHLMNPEVLAVARRIVEKVVRALMEKLSKEVRQTFSGVLDRRRRSPLKVARNFDFRRTLRENLDRYSPSERKVAIERASFFSRTRKYTERWQVILLVDQSGSMTSSVIHSAVTAACLWGLPGIQTHLIAFDTAVVDLTREVTDPVELLMKVQLGGGTDIQQAVAYGARLIEAPRRSIVVLITDFYEGGSPEMLVRRVKELCAQGTKVLGLAALEPDATPNYDRDLARRLVDVGAHVGAMTPGQLAAWIAEKVRA
ncbi:VWA domain containing CoxE-like protein [Archangium gephyra]|uniref:Mg-chelatase subunit ChlD n=1 Tax=Archangium gephyra TaxID=48 RepID=A0AAC8QAV2_9BACT|nr:VWA domain-containing protein [Archangium gephyra]AKJ04061.1 Mg-chelatase subunit ChlD [Archangium gephyra]REG37856.1 VWA domain containing CoxE-like protein [Archangium gephyra]